MKLNVAEKNACDSLTYVINTLGLKITTKTVKEQLYLHPDFPSVLSFSDVLNSWNVPNLTARVLREQLAEIPLPAIAYLEVNGGRFAPIRKVSTERIEWLDTQKGWMDETLEDFYRKWNHVVLMLEPNATSAEADYIAKRKEEQLYNLRKPFVIVGLCLCMLFGGIAFADSYKNLGWPYFGLVLTKIMGVIVSSLLLLHTIDASNSFLRTICGLDSRTDCNNILSSPAAKLWGWLGWSEIGFVYFSGGLITVLLSPLMPTQQTIQLLVVLSILALPYTLYSIYYQAFIAKNWCKLCVAVQLLFWAEFIIGTAYWPQLRVAIDRQGISLAAMAFLLPMVAWVFTKKPLQESTQVFPLKRELQKSKFNPEYVESLFEKQPQMPPIFENMQAIMIGNPDAAHTLTIVTNPMCGPCVRLHPNIEALVERSMAVKCQFVFSASARSAELAKQILGLPHSQMVEGMHQWYTHKTKNIEEWHNAINEQIDEQKGAIQLGIHHQWCNMAEITATPTLYLNGRQMPLLYTLDDVETLCQTLSTAQMYPTMELANSK
jgi:uncharacterized membrane protein